METKEKIESETDMANAKDGSDGLTKKLKQAGSDIKQNIKIAAAETKKKVN